MTKVKSEGIPLTAVIDPQTKIELESYCKTLDINASQLVRRLIKDELICQRWKGLNNV